MLTMLWVVFVWILGDFALEVVLELWQKVIGRCDQEYSPKRHTRGQRELSRCINANGMVVCDGCSSMATKIAWRDGLNKSSISSL